MSAVSPLAISLNFDSLNEAYGFPPGFRDVSFFEAFDRLAGLAARYSLPLSIYIIGKDLAHGEHKARVREWQAMGHEIGNHTWSHDYSLGSQSAEQVRGEIRQAHEAIAEVTGVAPEGFIAPAWSTSKTVVAELIRLGYRYDSSVFPSIFMYPLVLKSLMSHSMNLSKGLKILGRKDWHLPLCSPLEPYFVDTDFRKVQGAGKERLLILPLPTRGRFKVCSWHTAGFFFGWDKHYATIEKLSREQEGFYYLIHPADFIAPEDLSAQHTQYLERMDVPIAEKMRRLEDVFRILASSPRGVSTMAAKARFLADNVM